MLRIILFLLTTLFAIPMGIGQASIIDQGNKDLAKALSLTIPDHFSYLDKGDIDVFAQFLLDTENDSFDSLSLEKLSLSEAQKRKEWGLSAGTSIISNDYERGSWDVDYQSRAALNLEWDVMENGWYKNRQDAIIIQKQQETLIAEHQLSAKNRLYPNRYNQLVWAFNKEKTGLLNEAITFLDSLENIQTNLYHSHDLTYAALISTKEKKAAYKVMLQTYLDYNASFTASNDRYLTSISAAELPLITFPLEALIMDNEEALLLEQISNSKIDQIRVKYNPLKRHQLKVSAAYNYSFENNLPRNSHFSFGIRYKVPIVFDRKIQKEAIDLEIELETAQNDFVLFNRRKELMNYFQEYQYKIKQYLQFISKRTSLIEKIRIEKVLLKHNPEGHSPMLLFHYYTQVQQVQLELVDIKQMLYLNLLQIYSKTFVKNFNINDYEYGFLLSYLVKNEMTDFSTSSDMSSKLSAQLIADGLTEIDLSTVDLIIETIDCQQFDSRLAYENYITDKIIQFPYKSFLILNLDKLIELEQKSLALN